MRLLSFCLVLLLFPVITAVQDRSSLEVRLKLAREHAYYAARVDWNSIEAEAGALASGQGEEVAIGFVLRSLGDGHSFYMPPRKTVTAGPAAGQPAAQAPIRALSQLRPSIEGVEPVLVLIDFSLS